MDTRLALHELAARHGLSGPAAQALAARAGLGGEPARLARWLPQGVAVLAAALIGIGLVCWIAANWDDIGRAGRFALLQGLVLVTSLGALLRPAARTPLALLALIAIGGLFAYFGQTYQTGADPWQLFALWAALALPLALSARSDVLWAPWALVAMTGVSLWVHAHTGHRWRVEPHDLAAHAIGWGAAVLLLVALGPLLRRLTGAGAWAYRTATALAATMITTTAVWALFSRNVGSHYALGIAVLVLLAGVMTLRRAFDVFALSAVALALNVLLVCGLARWLFDNSGRGEPIGELLLLGLAAAGLLAATVSLVLRLARHHAPPAEAASLHDDEPSTVPLAEMADGGSGHPPRTLAGAVQQAIGDGLLPVDAQLPADTSRPWPVVLLTALGAWLAALPLLGVVGLLLGDLLDSGAGPYIVGVLMAVGAVTVLRAREVALFVEQLAIPALLVAFGALGFGLYRDLSTAAASAVLMLLAVGIALAVRAPWLRALLGATAAGLFVLACLPQRQFDIDPFHGGQRIGIALHLALAVWAAALVLLQRVWVGGAAARTAAAVESMAAGWLPAVLWGLAVWSGMTFLVGASGGVAAEVAREIAGQARPALGVLPWLSLLLAAAGAAWLARAWPGVRRPTWAAAALVLMALCTLMPALGAVLFALAVCVTSSRWRLAAACAVAAAWIVGAFYYQLHWSLSTKALVLIGAGAALGALAWFERRAPDTAAAATTVPAARAWPAGIALSLAAVLGVANVGIWQKQQLIAHGQPVFVELAPADPRSLMQGDFMRLRYALPRPAGGPLPSPLGAKRPRVVAQRDAQGVARLLRLDNGAALAANELRIELTPAGGGWTLVSDAWFFREGEAKRFEPARYAEFRVAPSGQALLVGLRDAQLRAL